MTSQAWDEDDALLDQLRAAVRYAGAPTPGMVAAGAAAFSWRTVDAELAALTHDSLADESVLVRNSAAPRSLVFEGRELSVELDETDDGLIGQLVPPTTGEVALLAPDGERGRTEVDDLGCFSFPTSAVGLLRLRCETPSGVLMTDWFRL